MKQYKNRFIEVIRQTVHKKYFYVLLAVIAVVIISLVYFKDKQMISPNDNPEIRLISVDYKKDGIYSIVH